MRARVWVGLALCALCMPIVDGSVGITTRLNDPPIVSSVLEQGPDRVIDAGAPDESTSPIIHGCGGASPCIAMRETPNASFGHRLALAAQTAEASVDHSHSRAMTALDLVLMVLFAVGLIGYQLDRKQRALRHSALFATPP